MWQDIAEELQRKAVKNFMDVFILAELRESSLSGYDIIGLIHKRFGILVSSGTVYSLLYSLERDGLIKSIQDGRKRVDALTEKGEQNIKVIIKANGEIQSFLRNILLISQS